MARTIFVTKQYVTTQINSETSARTVADTTIESTINTQGQKIALNTSDIAKANADITNETSRRIAQVGDMAFNPSLVNADLSAVTNLTQAVNASIRLKNEIDAQISGINVAGYAELQTRVNALQTKVNSDNQKIADILAGANVNYDTFAEILTLITAKDAETAADLAVIRSDLEALIATKMSKVQTSASALEYIDANDSSKKYKIVIVDGQLAVEDIL